MVQKTAATVVVHRVSEMTPEGRKAITKWLRRQAAWIDKYGDQLAVRFTARYFYEETLYGEDTEGERAEDERPGGVAPVVPEGLQPGEQGQGVV
jgi:hypothetical protein